MTTQYPVQQLAPFEIDFARFFGEVSGRVREMRQYRRLRALVPDTILIGKESLNRQVAPPSVTIVPTGFRYNSARRFPDSVDPIPIFSQWMILEVSCWGDDDPAKLDPMYSFSTAAEIGREVIVALCDSNFGPSSVRIEASEWVQETNIQRTGRKLFLRIEVETFVVRDPPIFMATATAATPGVSATVSANLQTQDGTSTVQEAVFVVPP